MTTELLNAVSRLLTAYTEGSKRARFLDGHRDLVHEIVRLEKEYLAAIGQPEGVPRKPYENKAQAHSGGGDKDTIETHESFGMIQFSRVSGSAARLFGSAIEHHQHFIRLYIRRGERIMSSLGYERYTETGRVPIVEIDLSAAQFAEAITCMNVGSGVPCTIRGVEGSRMDEVPEMESEVRLIDSNFRERTEEMTVAAKKHLAEIDAILAASSAKKTDKEKIRTAIWTWERHVRDSAPFMLKQFREAIESHSAKAKTEIESFVVSVVHKLGMKSVKDLARLGASENDKE